MSAPQEGWFSRVLSRDSTSYSIGVRARTWFDDEIREYDPDGYAEYAQGELTRCTTTVDAQPAMLLIRRIEPEDRRRLRSYAQADSIYELPRYDIYLQVRHPMTRHELVLRGWAIGDAALVRSLMILRRATFIGTTAAASGLR